MLITKNAIASFAKGKNRSICSFVAEAKQDRRFRQNRTITTSTSAVKDGITDLYNEPRQRHCCDRRSDKRGSKCAASSRRRQYGKLEPKSRSSSTRNGAFGVQNRVQKLPYGVRLHKRQLFGTGISTPAVSFLFTRL